MTNRPTTDLDPFETALLAELKQELRLGEPPATTGPATQWPHARRQPRTRWVAAASVAAALVVATQVPGLGPTPAYAVTGRTNGEVVVRVNRLEGADGLEGALREHGIASDITYLPEGKECAAGRYRERRTAAVLSVAFDWFEVTLPPGTVGKGDTFVVSAAVAAVPNGFQATVEFGITGGPVAPCKVVDSP